MFQVFFEATVYTVYTEVKYSNPLSFCLCLYCSIKWKHSTCLVHHIIHKCSKFSLTYCVSLETLGSALEFQRFVGGNKVWLHSMSLYWRAQDKGSDKINGRVRNTWHACLLGGHRNMERTCKLSKEKFQSIPMTIHHSTYSLNHSLWLERLCETLSLSP